MIGATIGEMWGDWITDDPNELTQAQKETIINQARLIAGIGAAFAGEDVNVAADMAAEAVRWNNTAQVMLIAEWDEINHLDYSKEMLEAIKRIPDNIASIHNYFNDMTIASFIAGMVGYTVIINNKNSNVWITGVTKEQDNGGPTYKLVPEVSINANI